MPRDLVLVRHGQSEQNRVNGQARLGDTSLLTEEVRQRHGSEWRLTSRGRRQAQLAGTWLAREFPTGFDRYYLSPYIRAMETAAHLGLPGAQWYPHLSLRERFVGDLEGLTDEERWERFPESMADERRNPFYWRPPNGDSIADQCELLYAQVLGTLHREMDGKRVIIVCHGDTIRSFQFLLERMTVGEWVRQKQAPASQYGIYNCQIFHYTRVNSPQGSLAPSLSWCRTVRPDGQDPLDEGWRTIHRTTYSNDELLQLAETVPVLVRDLATE